MGIRPLSITVSTSGFHPGNAGSIPAEVTKLESVFDCKSRVVWFAFLFVDVS